MANKKNNSLLGSKIHLVHSDADLLMTLNKVCKSEGYSVMSYIGNFKNIRISPKALDTSGIPVVRSNFEDTYNELMSKPLIKKYSEKLIETYCKDLFQN